MLALFVQFKIKLLIIYTTPSVQSLGVPLTLNVNGISDSGRSEYDKSNLYRARKWKKFIVTINTCFFLLRSNKCCDSINVKA